VIAENCYKQIRNQQTLHKMRTYLLQSKPDAFKKYAAFFLTLTFVFLSKISLAHRVETFEYKGCALGDVVQVDAVIVAAPSTTWYNWQYKDNSGNWKCFVNGSNNINGTNFTVSGASAANVANDAPLLKINNATAALENVLVRVIMRETASPCGAPAGTVYGGDDLALNETKYLRLHIYGAPGDCGATTPGCQGNFLTNGDGYYGGFENKFYNASTNTYTDKNFIAGAGQTAFTAGTAVGNYQVVNNPYAVNTGFGRFAPHTGNFQMVVRNTTSPSAKAWFKAGDVIPGATYSFCVWAARIDNTLPSVALFVKNGVEEIEIASASLNGAAGTWQQICGSYTIPAGVTTLEISIRNKNAAAGAHNYALDDICFRTLYLPASVGNRIWIDKNGNGIQDPTETTGQGGITVTLYRLGTDGLPNTADDIAVGSAITDAAGNYMINNIPVTAPGTNFFIKFTTLPAFSVFTIKNATGSNADNNSDVNVATKCTDLFTLDPGQTRLDLDGGITNPGGGSLPIHSFTVSAAVGSDDIVNLIWLAENELNTKTFVIERSTNGANYTSISSQPAAGNTNTTTKYTGSDNLSDLSNAGTVFYRIAAIDIDGKTGYSNVVVVNLNKAASLQVWPNPFAGQINIKVTVQLSKPLYVKVYGTTGQLVSSTIFNTARGTNFISVKDLDRLPKGLYHVEMIMDNERILAQKLIKQ
jgi:SdrD B-like domain/Secretion system C-terminal sorting domain